MTLSLGPVIGQIGGGGVEEIPVSMSGAGSGTIYPLATVDAGDGAIIVVSGLMSPSSTTTASRPHMQIGTETHEEPYPYLTGQTSGIKVGGLFIGTVQVAVLSRHWSSATSFTGTVYVARL